MGKGAGSLFEEAQMSSDNLRYYEERARQETEAAEKADHPTAASAHRLLAIEYEAHAKALRDRVPEDLGA
jgi:hypothetical protein